jgi:hypothetical protein
VNVQQTIIKGIRELLFTHNYLVLPGFGGFVLKANPAHFGNSGTLLLPAAKTVSFNAQLRQNDGILAHWLQEKMGCGAKEALQHLQDFTGYCSGILTARRRLTVDRIGFFYLDFEGNTCFEPQADSNFLTESFGLGPVSIKEIETPVAEAKREPVFVDRTLSVSTETVEKTRRSYRRMVVPVLGSLLVFSLLLLFVSTTRFSGQLRASLFGKGEGSSYQPFNYGELSLPAPKHNLYTYVADANGIANLDLGTENPIAVNILEGTQNMDIKIHARRPVSHVRAGFEIVLGCFTVRENANRMAARLMGRDIKAEISGKNEKGMYVVSDGHFENRQDAIARLTELKSNFPNAWIKKAE